MARIADPSIPLVRIDGFDDLQPIGRGGFSYVFSARQRDFNRRVALKVLSFGLADERERRAFERECRAMGLVSQHPHIVTVFNAAFTTTKQPCIVMELYSGGTLGDRLKREGPLPVATVLDVGVKIAGALQTAHDRGLLHRDIKPQNLFVSEFGEPALGDFGISTLDDERSVSGGGGLTVHYAPPEVLEGSPATPRSDVYSFAATLFTLLDGSRPFAPPAGRRQSVGELARRIMLEAPPRLRRDDAPRGLSTLLVQAMAKRPEERPPSAAELGRALQRVQGELGLAVTPLPLAVGAAESVPPPPPLPSLPATVDGEEEHAAPTVTVSRPGAADPVDEAAAATPALSTRRVVVGTVAGVVCLLAVAVSVLVFGRGGDPAEETDPTAPVESQLVDIRPPAPQDVTVVPGAGANQVLVTWTAVGDGEMRYQVEAESAELPPQRTSELAVTFDVDPGSEPCFSVQAITPRGQLSDKSSVACL